MLTNSTVKHLLLNQCKRREAIRLLQRAVAKQTLEINIEAQADHLCSTEALAQIGNLHQVVEDVCTETQLPDHAEKFGLAKPLGSKISLDAIKKRAQDLYQKVYASINAKFDKYGDKNK